MALVELMDVLETAAYVSFVLGAIFAIYQLRIVARDRKTQLTMQICEHWGSKDFEEALAKLWTLEFKDGKEAEEIFSMATLMMVIDYVDWMAYLARERLVDRDFMLNQINFEGFWDRFKPWIVHMREKYWPGFYTNLEDVARESRRLSSSS